MTPESGTANIDSSDVRVTNIVASVSTDEATSIQSTSYSYDTIVSSSGDMAKVQTRLQANKAGTLSVSMNGVSTSLMQANLQSELSKSDGSSGVTFKSAAVEAPTLGVTNDAKALVSLDLCDYTIEGKEIKITTDSQLSIECASSPTTPSLVMGYESGIVLENALLNNHPSDVATLAVFISFWKYK